MKVRTGFVSNSSSSSFIIPRRLLSNEQVELIENHMSVLNRRVKDKSKRLYTESDEWNITVNDHHVRGYTMMDNFPMFSYLVDVVGVDPDSISSGDGTGCILLHALEKHRNDVNEGER